MASPKILMTRNYRLFARESENRPLDEKRHRKLRESMQLYGFLVCFPIVVYRRGNLLLVKDGQHRLAFAEALGLPVYYVVVEEDFDIALINNTPKTWSVRDYAQKYAANGVEAYIEGLAFAEKYGLPVATAFGLLAGTTTFTNYENAFKAGTFEVKDRPWAAAVVGIYGPLVEMCGKLKGVRLVEACMAVCRVERFVSRRLLEGADRCRDRLVPYSTRDAYLEMMQEIYNYGRAKSSLLPLKLLAQTAMRERSAVNRKPA